MEGAQQPDLAAALETLWIQFLPQITERVEILEAAAQAYTEGSISPEQRLAATAAAHKLAGVLGTFGLTEGTCLARELEDAFTAEDGPQAGCLPQLAASAAALRALVERRS